MNRTAVTTSDGAYLAQGSVDLQFDGRHAYGLERAEVLYNTYRQEGKLL